MLAALTHRPEESEVCTSDGIPSMAVLAFMTPADRDLERRIAQVRTCLVQARTSFGRRMALAQLSLLEGRRSPTVLRVLSSVARKP